MIYPLKIKLNNLLYTVYLDIVYSKPVFNRDL